MGEEQGEVIWEKLRCDTHYTEDRGLFHIAVYPTTH